MCFVIKIDIILAIMCPSLSNPSNGIVSFNDLSIFSVATYSCNKGFFLVGLQVRECKTTGLWSEQEPVCQGAYNQTSMYY